MQQLRERGITVLLVEQNVTQSMEIADRAYVLQNSRIVMSGCCADLIKDEYVKKAHLGV